MAAGPVLSDEPRTSHWARAVPPAVLLLGLALTAVAWTASDRAVEHQTDGRFETEVIKLDSAITDRFAAYQQVLRGGLAFRIVEGDVSTPEWAMYVEELKLQEDYPGIQGVGYSLFIDAADLDAHEAEIQAQGFPNYTVRGVDGERPPGPRYTSIIQLEPFDARNRAAHGLDMYSHPERRAAMDRAIEEAVPALSGRVTLVQEIDEDKQPGFLLYLPHYAPGMPTSTPEERQAAVVGFVYAPFRAGDLMKGILGPGELEVTFEVYDNVISEDTLLYDEDGRPQAEVDADPLRQRVQPLTLAGRTWQVQYATTPSFEAALPTGQPALVGVSGLVISVLLFGVAFQMGRTQRRAVALARRMTRELRRSEREKARLADDLARSNSDLEQFAYIASHDLQEPARTVQSYVTLFERRHGEGLTEEGREILATAREGAQRMRVLIQSLLEYSRSGREATPSSPISADAALDAALEEADAGLQEVSATVEREPLPEVWIREPELARVFINLIGNSVKYRGADPLRIRIDAMRDGDKWVFTVEDNGIGLDMEHAERAFTMFGRLHSRDEYPGSGMGLAISKRINESVGGRMWVESAPGEGARFKFALPVGGPG